MSYWFGFWGKKTYTLREILDMVKDDEVLKIGEDEMAIEKNGGQVVKKFVKYTTYGNVGTVYIEKTEGS